MGGLPFVVLLSVLERAFRDVVCVVVYVVVWGGVVVPCFRSCGGVGPAGERFVLVGVVV